MTRHFFSFSYGKYHPLDRLFEKRLIERYYLDYNPEPIAKLLRENKTISQGMRDFVADMITGKIKRPNGKKASTLARDMELWREVDDLLRLGHQLTSLRIDGAGALDIVAGNHCMTEDAVKKAYDRGKKIAYGEGYTFYGPDGEEDECIWSRDEYYDEIYGYVCDDCERRGEPIPEKSRIIECNEYQPR